MEDDTIGMRIALVALAPVDIRDARSFDAPSSIIGAEDEREEKGGFVLRTYLTSIRPRSRVCLLISIGPAP